MTTSRLFIFFVALCFSGTAQVMNVRKWRLSERDSLDNALAMVDEAYYLHALPIFGELLQHHPNEQFLKYSYAKCALQRGDKQHEAYDLLNQIIEKSRKIPDIQFDMALATYYNEKFDDAMRLTEQYASDKKTSVEGKKNAERLKRYITYAKLYRSMPGRSTVSVPGDAINSEFDEFAPAINYDASKLLYTYAGPKSLGGLQNEDLGEEIKCQVYREDIYQTLRKDKRYQASAGLDSLNSVSPEQVGGLSPDGKALLIYLDLADGHGDIYVTRDEGISDPQPLKGKLNDYSREASASLSPDGKTIYFSSDRSGGFGGLDIYSATLSSDSTWTNIRNLGDSVNSPLDEDSPFMSADGVTLFFSSKGRTSMGGFDVFVTHMNPEDSTFSQTENLGTPVNGTSDDLNFVITADGRNAFFSSARKAGMGMRDIYQVSPQLSQPIAPVYIAKGKVTGSGKPRASRIDVEYETGSEKNYTTLYTDSITGDFAIILQGGQMYRLECTAIDFSVGIVNIDTRSLGSYTEVTHNITLLPPLALAVSGTTTGSKGTGSGSTPGKSGTGATSLVPVPGGSGSYVPLSSTVVAWPDKDGFMPLTLLQKKTMRFMQRYGDISAPGLEFRVQFAAVKGQGNRYFPELSKLGRVERVRLDDGYTRMTVGGGYSTMRKAFAMNKKTIHAGQPEAFVIALYKGKRVQYEELETLGIFR